MRHQRLRWPLDHVPPASTCRRPRPAVRTRRGSLMVRAEHDSRRDVPLYARALGCVHTAHGSIGCRWVVSLRHQRLRCPLDHVQPACTCRRPRPAVRTTCGPLMVRAEHDSRRACLLVLSAASSLPHGTCSRLSVGREFAASEIALLTASCAARLHVPCATSCRADDVWVAYLQRRRAFSPLSQVRRAISRV